MNVNMRVQRPNAKAKCQGVCECVEECFDRIQESKCMNRNTNTRRKRGYTQSSELKRMQSSSENVCWNVYSRTQTSFHAEINEKANRLANANSNVFVRAM
jgi:hypothetical protein